VRVIEVFQKGLDRLCAGAHGEPAKPEKKSAAS
jgi:hypothetical protein